MKVRDRLFELRHYFAGQALCGLLAQDSPSSNIAKEAFEIANDMMIEARANPGAPEDAPEDTPEDRNYFRLESQARAISRMLSDAGIGPCPIDEGVRRLIGAKELAEHLNTLNKGGVS
jgi:hypothetical protein